MENISKKYFTAVLTLIFITSTLSAYSGEIITGRELLKAMRGSENSSKEQPQENNPVRRNEDTHPNAMQLLNIFRANKEQSKSFIAKSKNKLEQIDTVNNYEAVKYNSTVFRTDGSRVCHRQFSWGDVTNKARDIKKEDARYKSFLWDGEMFIEYRPSVTSMEYTRAYIRKDDKQKKAMLAASYRGAPFLGIFEGDYKPIDSVFLGPDTISLSVRKQMERVNGSRCYVIDADTKRGKYSVWLDPTHGYNIAKAEVLRRKGDLVYGHKEPKQQAEIRFSLKEVSFKKINKVWIPWDAKYEITWLYGKLGKALTKVHHTRTEITINPDHEALGSFEPDDIKNGTHVFLLDATEKQYLWQDGKVVDANGEVILNKAKPGKNPDKSATKSFPDVDELLDKYAQTQDKLQSYIIKSEISIKVIRSRSGKRQYYGSIELRFDGIRNKAIGRSWGEVRPIEGDIPREKCIYTSFLWDGKIYLRNSNNENRGYGPSHDVVVIDKNKDPYDAQDHVRMSGACALRGYFFGSTERIDKILNGADKISLRDRMESIGENQCYVIEANTKHGRYKIWIDPERGYNIAKAIIRRSEGDIINHGRYILKDGESVFTSLNNVSFEKIDNIWIPMEADAVNANNVKGDSRTKVHYKNTEVILNPDHEALGSFVPDDVRNGAKVFVAGIDNISYTWQDGKVVDANGKVIDFEDKGEAKN